MMNTSDTNNTPALLATEIASRALSDGYDVLLACRALAELRSQLPKVPEKIMDIFIAVASETDGLPLGEDRQRWDINALKKADEEAQEYRSKVQDLVRQALQELVVAIQE